MKTMMNQYFGVDGGGSKTHLITADKDGNPGELFQGKGTNHQTSDIANKNYQKLFSKIKNQKFKVGVLCVAGWDFESDKKIVRSNIQNALDFNNIKVENLIIENDVYAILKSGLGVDSVGVVFTSGTGTICACQNRNQFYRTYSCGFVSGEWGSGHDMSEYALNIICAAEKGIEEPVPILKEKALNYFNTKDVDELVEKIVTNQFTVQIAAKFLEEIIEAYNSGCPGAKEVLEKGGHQHAKTVYAMLKKVNSETAPVILGGGVFSNGFVLPGFKKKLKSLYGSIPELRLVKSKPVYGALLWALQSNGTSTEKVSAKLEIEVINKHEFNIA